MKNEFTVEESNLISIYTEEGTASGLGSRAKVIKSISDAMEHLEDDEMMELSLRVIVKQPAARISLKARLAEKKAQVAGQNQDHDAQENSKNNQREM